MTLPFRFFLAFCLILFLSMWSRASAQPVAQSVAPYGITLLSGGTGTTDGVWLDMGGRGDFSVHVEGTFVGTVVLRGSNTPTQPANATDHVQLGTPITAEGIVHIIMPLRWLKAEITAHSSGTINVYASGVR